ncbi:hypothetical protein ACFLIN_01810 [Corynebacterium kutscheri]|uniref:hypothetical protein n=1 Tax=Corynebacterium kutscheri TaxID=35755 RepID=UPI0037BF5A71
MTDQVQPIADLNDSLLGWASQTELELAQKLAKVNYVYELGLATDQLERIERLYGIFLTRQLAAGADMTALLKISPALTLTAASARAFKLVDSVTFFSELAAGFGLELTQAQELGAALASTIELSAGLDIVNTLCTHAGIISTEIPYLLELLDQGVDVYDQAPTHFKAMAEAQPATAQVLLNGLIELRDFAIEHPKSWFDRNRSHLTLPTHIHEEAAAELRERPVGTLDRTVAVGVAGREMRPRVVFDVRRSKICLRLPEQPLTEPEGFVTWRISIDGTTKVYRTTRAWGDVSGFSEALDIAIDRPVREITVQDLSHNLLWTVPVVRAEDPILIFSLSGSEITEKASLHHQQVRVVVPNDYKLIDVVTGVDFFPESEQQVEGWAGWSAQHIDTSTACSMAAIQNGMQPSMDKVRSIEPRQRVRFRVPGDAIDCLHSISGLPVHSHSLLAEFPPTLSGQTETWHLAISSYGGVAVAGEEITQPEPLEVPAEGGIFHVFDPDLYDGPWVGEYLVRMRGPRNESFRHEFAIVEGAHAVLDISGACRSFRIPSAGGLSEASLVLKPTAKAFVADPQVVSVAPMEAGADLIVHTEEGDQLPLRFNPPRLTFELPLITEPAMWRASRLKLRPRELNAVGELRVRGAGRLIDPKVSVRNHHGAPVKTSKLTSCDSGITYSVDMAGIASSAAVMPQGRIDVEWTDPHSDRRVSVALADIYSSPEPEITLVDDSILVEGVELAGMWVWPITAPWTSPITLIVEDGRAALPENLIGAGPLKVQLHSLDPFMTLHTPSMPGKTALRLEQAGYFVDADEHLTQLSAFLAGESEEIPESQRVIPLLWDMIVSGRAFGEARKAIQQVLRAHPATALYGLSDSLVPAEKQPGRIVESGLVRCIFGTEKQVGEETTYHRAPWLGALELLGEFDAIATQESVTGEPLDKIASSFALMNQSEKVSEVVDKLGELAGDNMINILRTGRDTTLDTACIDHSTVAIASMDASQQEALLDMFFSRSNIVPGAIMDDGSRLLAVFETFTNRDKINDLLSSEGLISSAVTLLRTLRSTNKSLYAMARIRFDKLDGVDTDSKDNMWSLAPVVSFVLAMAARMNAHGLITSNKALDAVTDGWAALADVVPDLVTSDLVAADAIVLAIKHPGVVV